MTTKRTTKSDVVGSDHYDPMKEPRYTEIATFMRAPLAQGSRPGRRSTLTMALIESADLTSRDPGV